MKNNGRASAAIRSASFPRGRSRREVPHPLGKFANSEEAWFRRIQSGQAGEFMFSTLVKELGAAPLRYFADWTDRIAKGELPDAKPAAAARSRAQHRCHYLGLA